MTKWADDPKRQSLSGPRAERLLQEEEEHRAYRRRLEGIKAYLDLFGEEALDDEQRALVEKHRGFFYPEEE